MSATVNENENWNVSKNANWLIGNADRWWRWWVIAFGFFPSFKTLRHRNSTTDCYTLSARLFGYRLNHTKLCCIDNNEYPEKWEMKAERITQFVVAGAGCCWCRCTNGFSLFFFHRNPPSGLQTMCRPPEHSAHWKTKQKMWRNSQYQCVALLFSHFHCVWAILFSFFFSSGCFVGFSRSILLQHIFSLNSSHILWFQMHCIAF